MKRQRGRGVYWGIIEQTNSSTESQGVNVFDGITRLEILVGVGVITAVFIVIRLSKIIQYIENMLLQQQAQLASDAKQKKFEDLAERYRRCAHSRSDSIEYLEAIATYRRLADACVQDQFNDPERENDGNPWDERDERHHAMRIAELRHEKHHFEEMASSARREFCIPESPSDSLKEMEELSRKSLREDYPIPETPSRIALGRRTREAIEKGRKKRLEAERAKNGEGE